MTTHTEPTRSQLVTYLEAIWRSAKAKQGHERDRFELMEIKRAQFKEQTIYLIDFRLYYPVPGSEGCIFSYYVLYFDGDQLRYMPWEELEEEERKEEEPAS